MNSKLQTVFDIIQQSERLDAEQKESLLKAVKDADKELEITAFKLERTEKVKKTTAILLEETIEELEQKRKAVEEQNRELEIETTLEKVRTIAMGMREPADMLDVCKTISLQLQSLDVKEIRNVQTAIFYEQRGTYMNYEYYAKHDRTFITETVFTNNEIHNEFATKMLKGKGETFITHIKGDEVKDWIAYQKTTNVFIDKYLETASSLNYYWFSLGPVALGISTYHPLTEEEINLFKRFLKVFELAYQRYLDIEKAEAQAREAQIEASLERVRAVAMSMNKSEDLLSICEISFKEFKRLGFDNLRNAVIHMLNDEKRFFIDYDYSDYLGGSIININYNSHPVIENYLEQIKKANDAFAEVVVEGKELDSWKDFRRRSGQLDDPRLDKIPALYYYLYSIGVGDIGISTFKPIEKDQLDILKRFRNVFNLSYQRYSDIAHAESQARESQIELALERVRARTMAMQKSEELKEVIRVVYEQFVHLKINVDHAGFVVDYKPKGDWHFWIADEREIPSKITHPYFESVWANQFNEAKEKGLEFFTTNLNFEEKNKFYNELLSYVSGLPQASKDFYLSCPGLAASTALFDSVSLYIENFSGIPYKDEENSTLIRFGKVFQQTYTRFLDLQKAEAQAREAEIQLGLERVRARSLAMHNTSELQDVVNILSQQLHNMNMDINGGVFIAINDEVDIDIPLWASGGAADYVQKVTVPFLNKPVFIKLRDAIKRKNNFFTEEHSQEDKIGLFKHLFKYPPWNSLTQQRKQELISREGGYTRSVAISQYTSISITNHNGKKFSDDDNEILKRFGNVFEQSYIRFLDLQKAEAQAREAQIEAALERVRAKAMAMNSSEDLAITVDTFFLELNKLNIIPHRCGVGIVNLETRIADIRATAFTKENISKKIVGKLKLAGHPVLDKIFESWKFQQEYHPVLKGNEISEYYKVMNPQVEFPDFADDEIQYGHYFHFKEGGVFAWTDKELKEEDLQIFRRYTSVLSLTYRRYIELKEAEKQAIEATKQASLDRVRAEIASMRTTEDLQRITPIIWRELKTLEVPFIRCGVFIVDEANTKVQVYLTTPDGKSLGVLHLPFDSDELTNNTVKHWQKKQIFKTHWNKEEFINWTNSMIEIGQVQNAETYQGSVSPPESLDLHFVPFDQGMLYVGNTSPLSEEKLQLVKSLAEAFSIAYARYDDFKRLEEAKTAVDSAFTELDLLSKELKVKNEELEKENRRKAIELEEARQLQLSMLPKELPKLPNLQIAAFMRTATEVGGDYYDFILEDNGVLNIGFGDATGHGLQAGTMITLMKGFFTSDAAKLEPQEFMEHCSKMIREIKLGRILMSFSLLRFINNKLLISSAGMPPVYFYEKAKRETEEILIPGFPLGAMTKFQYKLVEKELKSGDTLLLLTDGLPEQINSGKEMFNYHRVKKHFNEKAECSPEEIIKNLINISDEWMNGTPQTDDMTFIVIKVK
jgi:serine phosphatase RsbU (regulator of sigma subunit)